MDKAVKTFRFDDVCLNIDIDNHDAISKYLLEKGFHVIWAVSPLVHKINSEDSVEKQRVFPKILNAYSDFRHFFEVDDCGTVMQDDKRIEIASHGIIHVDHRLMERAGQELSIVTSCSLLKAKKFVPPFNKWTKQMDEICKEWGIELIKFEDGWKCIEYNIYDPKHNLWYLHARDWTLESIKHWFGE